jgi:hypothetical protein
MNKFIRIFIYIINLVKFCLFFTYFGSSIALFVPFNTSSYVQYTFNGTIYIVKSNLNKTNGSELNFSSCTGNSSASTFYLISLVSQDGWYRNGIYFQYYLSQALLIGINALQNYFNLKNIKLTKNFLKLILNSQHFSNYFCTV